MGPAADVMDVVTIRLPRWALDAIERAAEEAGQPVRTVMREHLEALARMHGAVSTPRAKRGRKPLRRK